MTDRPGLAVPSDRALSFLGFGFIAAMSSPTYFVRAGPFQRSGLLEQRPFEAFLAPFLTHPVFNTVATGGFSGHCRSAAFAKLDVFQKKGHSAPPLDRVLRLAKRTMRGGPGTRLATFYPGRKGHEPSRVICLDGPEKRKQPAEKLAPELECLWESQRLPHTPRAAPTPRRAALKRKTPNAKGRFDRHATMNMVPISASY
jgi:hypothetical protein